MKQPTAPPLYPELPTGDGQNYRLQKISEIEQALIKERNDREALYKKYKRCINITDGVDTTFLSGGIIIGGIGLAIPLLLPLEIAAVVFGVMGGCINLIRRKLHSKAKKHDEIKMIAEAKLNSIKNIISNALQDGQITENEFKTVLDEMEKFSTLKQDIKQAKNSGITEEERKKLIEEGKQQAMDAIQKKIKDT
jgi:hypothetical protein